MTTPRVTAELIELHMRDAQRLRAEAIRAALGAVWRAATRQTSRADAPPHTAAAACR